MRARSSLVDATAEELRQMILSGQWRQGEFLPPQRELATRFEVGTSTIREAVQCLIAVGLLQSHPGKGTWVRAYSLDTLVDPRAAKARLGQLNAYSLCEARAVVEVALSGFAAERAAPQDVAQIRMALDAMRAHSADTAAFVKADLDFHLAVANAAHNDLLGQFYHLARTLLEEVIHELIALPNVKQESIAIQAGILAAIEARDPRQARHAAEKHMQYIYRLVEQ
jgi:GntR family transcriptional regulator, transcriptional repressor for pyruvate dehydrogenase complex